MGHALFCTLYLQYSILDTPIPPTLLKIYLPWNQKHGYESCNFCLLTRFREHSRTKTSQNAVTPLTDFGEAERYETGMQVRLRREDPNENNIDRD